MALGSIQMEFLFSEYIKIRYSVGSGALESASID